MASFETPSYIQMHEYLRARTSRVDEADVQPDQVYMAMLRGAREQDAAKLPARVQTVRRETGILVAQIAFMNMDLETRAVSSVGFSAGYLETFSSGVIVYSPEGLRDAFKVQEGFLKGYDEGFDSVQEAISRELLAPEELRLPLVDRPPQRVDASEV